MCIPYNSPAPTYQPLESKIGVGIPSPVTNPITNTYGSFLISDHSKHIYPAFKEMSSKAQITPCIIIALGSKTWESGLWQSGVCINAQTQIFHTEKNSAHIFIAFPLQKKQIFRYCSLFKINESNTSALMIIIGLSFFSFPSFWYICRQVIVLIQSKIVNHLLICTVMGMQSCSVNADVLSKEIQRKIKNIERKRRKMCFFFTWFTLNK